MTYYIYMLRCGGGAIYTGITTDVARRMDEHFGKTEKCAKFTRSHHAEALEALWSVSGKGPALRLEYRIKQLSRQQKLMLIRDNSCFASFFGEDAARLYRRENTVEYFPIQA